MHLPLLALLWVVVVFTGTAALLLLAILLTQFADELGDSLGRRRSRMHEKAKWADYERKRRTIDEDFRAAQAEMKAVAARCDRYAVDMLNAATKLNRATAAFT